MILYEEGEQKRYYKNKINLASCGSFVYCDRECSEGTNENELFLYRIKFSNTMYEVIYRFYAPKHFRTSSAKHEEILMNI